MTVFSEVSAHAAGTRRAPWSRNVVERAADTVEKPSHISVWRLLDRWVEGMVACPWGAHAGISSRDNRYAP